MRPKSDETAITEVISGYPISLVFVSTFGSDDEIVNRFVEAPFIQNGANERSRDLTAN